jgi:ABC-type uncharacterized transport system involved in gliding motility auxiliary subunit
MGNRIFGYIGWLGTAFVFAGVGIRVAIRFELLKPGLDPYAIYLAWAGIACMVIYIASQWREIAAFFDTRQARYGTLAASSVLIVFGILIALNFIGKRQHRRWDLTAAKQFSLSDQSRNVVSKLDAPLEVMVFARDSEAQPYRDRWQEYAYAAKQLKVQYIDPDKQPAVAQQNQIQQYGTMVLNYKGRTDRITSNSEQDITGSIIKLVSGQQRKVYFTGGHGEKDTVSTERDGYSGAVEALKRENYAIEPLVLAQKPTVPDDASVVVVAGPKSDFFGPEIEALKAYLAKGGKLLLLIDPPDRPDSAPLTNLLALAHEWGIDLGNNIVVDVSGMGQLFGASEAVPVAASYPSHPITQRFRTITAYPLARSVDAVSGGVGGHTAQAIVETSPQSWAETDLKAIASGTGVAMDEGKDKPGPVALAAAVSAPVTAATPPPADTPDAPKPETRVVVFGDSDFAGNSTGAIPGNRDLFMNALGWLSQQENLISIRPKQADDRRFDPIPAGTQTAVIWASWLLMPVLVLGAGVLSWWRRG